MRPLAVYSHLCQRAKASGIPTRFLTDLTTHDKRWLVEHADTPFCWGVYADGTILVAGCEDADIDLLRRSLRAVGGRTDVVEVFDGRCFRTTMEID